MRAFTWICVGVLMASGCTPSGQAVPTTPPVTGSALYVFRLEPPALIELSGDGSVLREVPATVPDGCALDNTFAPPVGSTLAIELACSFGQAVVWVDTASGKITQPITDSDSHFMAWAPDGQSAYLKVDTVSRPHIVRAPLVGKARNVPITELTYDISPDPASQADFLFSFSRGMGQGSEMWSAKSGGKVVNLVLADPHSYISFARWSPDRTTIAFIKIPDSATPFTVGELWVMHAGGSNAHKLADADAGHGFAEAWSPDGTRLAFVVRENPLDAQADQSAAALQSNLAVVNVKDGKQSGLTNFQDARVEAPSWSPDGMRVAFTAVLNDKMNVYLADTASGQVQQVLSVPACCPVWMRK